MNLNPSKEEVDAFFERHRQAANKRIAEARARWTPERKAAALQKLAAEQKALEAKLEKLGMTEEEYYAEMLKNS